MVTLKSDENAHIEFEFVIFEFVKELTTAYLRWPRKKAIFDWPENIKIVESVNYCRVIGANNRHTHTPKYEASIWNYAPFKHINTQKNARTHTHYDSLNFEFA